MSWFLQLLDGGQLTNFIFLVVAIIGVVLSIIFYIKSRREKELRYKTKSFVLIENSTSSIDNLTIQYGDECIETLSLTKFSFWNNGKATIDGNDIARSDRLRVELADSIKIYNARIEMTVRKSNSIKIEVEDNTIFITFDFLDYGDGAIIIFYHAGKNESSFNFKGTLKGALPIRKEVVSSEDVLIEYIKKTFIPYMYYEDFNDLNIFQQMILVLIGIIFIVVIMLLTPLFLLLNFMDLVKNLFFRRKIKKFDLSDS